MGHSNDRLFWVGAVLSYVISGFVFAVAGRVIREWIWLSRYIRTGPQPTTPLELELEVGGVVDVSLDVKRFLRTRRDRAVGSILGYAESEIRPLLTKDQWESLRKVVLDATNSYHDTILDLVKSEDVARNDHLVALLESVDTRLQQQQRQAIAESDANHQRNKDGIVEDAAEIRALHETH